MTGGVPSCFSLKQYVAITDGQKLQVVKEFMEAVDGVTLFGKLNAFQKCNIARRVQTVRTHARTCMTSSSPFAFWLRLYPARDRYTGAFEDNP